MMYLKVEGEVNSPEEFDVIRLGIASPEAIHSWSYGEVKKPETINYRTQKPERDGLFCEKIFGPVKDYECNCGKYKGPKYKGVICERCGVEVTLSRVRRERMGHIDLIVPVAHVWFYRVVPSRIGLLLGISKNALQRVLYYESYIVVDPKNAPLEKCSIITESEYEELRKEYGDKFDARMGAEPIYDLLKQINLDKAAEDLKVILKNEVSEQKRSQLLKKRKIVEAFRGSGNRPEWMILKVIPVIPPDFRPLVHLEGGMFATSDLNDLYRRVITRNNRLKNLMDIGAPEIIMRNEKRMLQEAVDALFDNSRLPKPIKGRGNRPLKSIADSLKGKQGRFRQNLLGKRVDYSGRSVITVDPTLKLNECGLPKTMAIELFKPFITRKLEEKGISKSVKSAKLAIEREIPKVWDMLEDVVRSHPVLLNRAPTLHRVSVEAFEPKLVEGKAIRIHPLVCPPFNADFDGDQMAVHVPLSFESQLEAYVLMLAPNNILSPASGEPLIAPTKDMIIGLYYITKDKKDSTKNPKYFDSLEGVEMALDMHTVSLHSKIKYKFRKKFIETTPGRVIFNSLVPKELRFINKTMTKKDIHNLIKDIFKKKGMKETALFLDKIKEIGFEYSTLAGLTIGIDDMIVPKKKIDILKEAEEEVNKWQSLYKKGVITDSERYNNIIDVWTRATDKVTSALAGEIKKDKDGFNPIYMMAHSGARGNMDQVRQISGVRGLMAKPQKRLTAQSIIETPIRSNFRDGLSVIEYFISSHGARKGLTDTALKTGEAGYLTRRLVDVAKDVVVMEEDCGTIMGIEVTAIKEREKVLESLAERVTGAFAADDVVDDRGELIVEAGEEITEEKSTIIEARGIEKVKIRSVLTCESRRGVCQKCYGRNLATGKLVEIGEAVGVMAAQSIGEPGTQLTLRTFHVGGVATRIAEQSSAQANFKGKIKFQDITAHYRKKDEGIVLSKHGVIWLEHSKGTIKYNIPYGAILKVKDKDKVSKGTTLFKWDPYSNIIITETNGKVKFVNIIPGVTLVEYSDQSGKKQPMVVEEKTKKYHPFIEVYKSGKKIGVYSIPAGAYLFVKDGDKVKTGDMLAKIPREIFKTRDITGGLPRVADLFEARHPKDAAIISEIDGIVSFGKIHRGDREIFVDNGFEKRKYKVPYRKYLTVHEGERIKSGDKLCEGPIDPHDILTVKGVLAAQQYLLNEVQEVYRLQNVKIDDKHIGIIVKQMFQKVKIQDAGETNFIEGEIVNKVSVIEENEEVMERNGQPATFEPIFLGITKAALSTDSFIASASFQETTRVLTEAAIQGKRDLLNGIKENVIMGNLIPAGTGLRKYKRIKFEFEEEKEKAKTA